MLETINTPGGATFAVQILDGRTDLQGPVTIEAASGESITIDMPDILAFVADRVKAEQLFNLRAEQDLQDPTQTLGFPDY